MDKEIYTKSEVKQIVKKYKELLQQKGFIFDSFYLFGSYSRGPVRPWSDIDVAIVSHKFGKDPIKEGLKLDELADQVSLALEPHPINSQDFKAGLLPIVFEIQKHGIKI